MSKFILYECHIKDDNDYDRKEISSSGSFQGCISKMPVDTLYICGFFKIVKMGLFNKVKQEYFFYRNGNMPENMETDEFLSEIKRQKETSYVSWWLGDEKEQEK